jgi:hypothetical protein
MVTKTDPDKTKKLGNSPAVRTEDALASNMTGSLSKNGRMEIFHEDHKDPTKSWSEHQTADGSWKTTEYLTSEIAQTNEHDLGHRREYVGKGKSEQVDQNSAAAGGENRHEDYKKDTGAVTGNNKYDGTAKKEIGGSGEGSFKNNTGGDTYATSNGNIVHLHSGHVHMANEGDHVESVQGNKHVMVGEGEYGIHVQGGNMDVSVETGRMHLYSGSIMVANSPSPIFITSLTNIRLQVGASIISLTPAGITITAPLVTVLAAGAISATAGGEVSVNVGGAFNLTADGTALIDSASTTIAGEAALILNSAGPVVTAGAVTDIQGGGNRVWNKPGTPLMPSTFI